MLSRLSFRAKLLLVLFVPFLALVVVAAAGLSDRFTVLHAQEQYGDLSAPLRSLDDASRAIQNESVVSSWYVAGNAAPAEELQAARTRTDAAVAEFRANEQAFADAGLSGTAAASLDATNRGLDDIPEMRGQVDARTADAATTRDFFLGVDGHLLDFGERAARDLASSDVSASLTRVFALQRSQHEFARGASIYIAVLASGAPQNFSDWIGAQSSVAALPAAVHQHRDRERARRLPERDGGQGRVDGPARHLPRDDADPGRLLRRVPAADAQGRRRHRRGRAGRQRPGQYRRERGVARDPPLRRRRGVRHAPDADVDLVRVELAGRPTEAPHRGGARDVAASAARPGRVAPHRW